MGVSEQAQTARTAKTGTAMGNKRGVSGFASTVDGRPLWRIRGICRENGMERSRGGPGANRGEAERNERHEC